MNLDSNTATCTCPTTASLDFIIALPSKTCGTPRCGDHSIYSSATKQEAAGMTSFIEGNKIPYFPDFTRPKICP
jgi:hypothetical protein